MFYIYIIYSPSTDTYYTGYTGSGIEKRLSWHNDGSSRSTKAGIPWKVVYKRAFSTKREAIQREIFIKRQKSRAFIERLIASGDNEL